MAINDLEARRKAIENALKAYNDGNNSRTETFEFRGELKSFPVVRVKPVILLLNPNNSRIRAQLEDHPKKDHVHKDQFSSEAQDVIASLLRQTDQFKNLKTELRDLNQQYPGIISRDGLLINGNTRVVALRELGTDGVDVAVLPEDATAEDFLDIEMNVQMRNLTHQDYSFTNELLLMREYLRLGHSKKQLGLKMGWTKGYEKKISQSLRMLETIEQIRKLSDTHLPYSEFDTKKQHLKDLDDAYESLKLKGELIAAEKMKWSRVAAMLLGANKDQVRTIDDDFFDENVQKRIQGKEEVSDLLSRHTRVSVPDTFGGLIEPDDDEDNDALPTNQIDMKAFVGTLLNEKQNRSENGELSKDLDGPVGDLAEAVRRAAIEIINEENLETFKTAPSGKLQEARFKIEGVIESLKQASEMEGFNLSAFEDEMTKTEECYNKLKKILAEIKKSK